MIQSVPDLVAASSTNSLYTLLCISTAETASAPLVEADESVMYVDVPVVTTEVFGLTFCSVGSVLAPPLNCGMFEYPSSATASAVTSSPCSTLISVMPPNRPPVPTTVSDEAPLNGEQAGTPLLCVTAAAVAPIRLPISMIST